MSCASDIRRAVLQYLVVAGARPEFGLGWWYVGLLAINCSLDLSAALS